MGYSLVNECGPKCWQKQRRKVQVYGQNAECGELKIKITELEKQIALKDKEIAQLKEDVAEHSHRKIGRKITP